MLLFLDVNLLSPFSPNLLIQTNWVSPHLPSLIVLTGASQLEKL